MTHKRSSKKRSPGYVQKPPKEELPFDLKEIKNPTELPEHYLLVDENWMNRIEHWDEKLRKNGMQVKKPLTIYRLPHVVQTIDLCLEVVPVEA